MTSRQLRKLTALERLATLRSEGFSLSNHLDYDQAMVELADTLVENAIGYATLPLGLAGEFLIDGESYFIPLCTEEPSVIAAASFAGSMIAKHGGFRTLSSPSIIEGTLYIDPENNSNKQTLKTALNSYLSDFENLLSPYLASMTKRGGGLKSISIHAIDNDPSIRLLFELDVVDAMGANLVNTCAEALRQKISELSLGSVILAILSNESQKRISKAEFSFPVDSLARAGLSGELVAHKIVRANEIAIADPKRAITHNKGIMNGISALALASANDTRAIEASVHAFAARTGQYQALTHYAIEDGCLKGELSLPLAFGVVGGSTKHLDHAQASLELLRKPSASKLGVIAASLGLAQNFAALWALTSEGIQMGHMKLHNRRNND